MNHEDIVDLLTYCAAIDRRTVGDSDILAWHDVIGEHPRDLAFRAARDHYREEPGVWLEPGHIHQRVRAIRRDMLEHEHAERMRVEIDAKVATIAAEVAAKKAIPDANPDQEHRRPERNPHDPRRVPCKYCHASVGSPCIAQSTVRPGRAGRPMRLGQRYHPSRIEAAAASPPQPPEPAEDAAWPACAACGHPLVTDEDTARGVCTPCQQASTPQQPETEVPEKEQRMTATPAADLMLPQTGTRGSSILTERIYHAVTEASAGLTVAEIHERIKNVPGFDADTAVWAEEKNQSRVGCTDTSSAGINRIRDRVRTMCDSGVLTSLGNGGRGGSRYVAGRPPKDYRPKWLRQHDWGYHDINPAAGQTAARRQVEIAAWLINAQAELDKPNSRQFRALVAQAVQLFG